LTAQARQIRKAAAGHTSRLDSAAHRRPIEPAAPGQVPDDESQVIRLLGSACLETPTVAAQALLTKIMARLPDKAPHLVQFLSFDAVPAARVIREFCVAAAHRLGNVLQAELAPPRIALEHDSMFPDAAVARLYHRRLNLCPLDVVRHGRSALLHATEAEAGGYDMVVFDSQFSDDGLGSTILASAFSGTVLVVRAGSTTLAQLRRAVDEVQQAGGVVLGAVLADVPPPPAWLRRFGIR